MKFYRRILVLPALCICAAGADETRLHTLSVAAGTPDVSVKPQPPGRRTLVLPALDYVFRVEARCHDDWTPQSLSLNVADSRISKAGEELKDLANQQLDLNVPGKQLAPLTLRDFCVIDTIGEGSAAAAEMAALPRQGKPAPGRLTINAALAHASLRCSNGEEQETLYVSEPLDVTLICEEPEANGGITAR